MKCIKQFILSSYVMLVAVTLNIRICFMQLYRYCRHRNCNNQLTHKVCQSGILQHSKICPVVPYACCFIGPVSLSKVLVNKDITGQDIKMSGCKLLHGDLPAVMA